MPVNDRVYATTYDYQPGSNLCTISYHYQSGWTDNMVRLGPWGGRVKMLVLGIRLSTVF